MSETFDVDNMRLPNGYLILTGEPLLEDTLERLSRCRYIRRIFFRDSASGCGYHIRLECGVEGCEVCRLAFDNSYRYMLDCLFRRPHQRNVLWRRKTYQKANKCLTLNAGDWIEYELSQIAHPRSDFNPLGESKIVGAQRGVSRADDLREGGYYRGTRRAFTGVRAPPP